MKAILLTVGVSPKTGRQYDAEVVQKALPAALEKVRQRTLFVYVSEEGKSLEELQNVVGVVTGLEFDGTQLVAEIELTRPQSSELSFTVGGTGLLFGHIVRDWSLDAVLMEMPVTSTPAEPKDESPNQNQD